ncbi:MAG TPA: glycosyltransferase family 4 protein [Nitrospirota bacterium]|nr:glycosyltransferase family 4 protein [Nitrospirota bacterium]
MNVVFIMLFFKTGGGTRVIVELANALAKSGHTVDILFPAISDGRPTFSLEPDVRVVTVGRSAKNAFSAIINIAKMFWFVRRERKESTLIITDPMLSLLSIFLRRKRAYRFLQADDYIIFDDLHLLKSKLVLRVYKTLTRISYRYRMHFLFNSRFVWESFLAVSGRDDVPCLLVHPGVERTVFFNRNVRCSDELNICLVGRAHPWKGFAEFVEAWKGLKAVVGHRITNIFVISSDNLSQFDCRDFTLVKPSSDAQIADVYNHSHIFVSTSWWEGFGLPPLEAMSCGCAVLVTNTGGVHEYAVSGRNCLMCEPKSIPDLQEKLLILISDGDLRKIIAEEGMITARQFGWGHTADQFLRIIEHKTS